MVRWNYKLYVEVPTEKKSNLITSSTPTVQRSSSVQDCMRSHCNGMGNYTLRLPNTSSLASILVFYHYYKPTGVSSPPHVDLTRIAILSTCSIRRSGIPIPAVVCDLTAMGWVTVLNNRLLRLGRIQLRVEDLVIQMDCIRPSNLSKIVSISDTAKVCQGWFLSIQSR